MRRASNSPYLVHTSSVAPALIGEDQCSSKRLLEVLIKYHQDKPGRLAKDLKKSKVLNKYLKLQDSTLTFKQEHLSASEYKELLTALKATGHRLGSTLRGKLKRAWQEAKPDNPLQQQQVGHDQALDRSTLTQPAMNSIVEEKSADVAYPPAGPSQVPSHGSNPFTSDETSDSYPDSKNPFADDDDAAEVTAGSSTSMLVETPNRSALAARKIGQYLTDLNRLSEDDSPLTETGVLPQVSASDVSNEKARINPQSELRPVAESDLECGTREVFLQLLNQYLRTDKGKSFGNINEAHVKKIREDIKAESRIAKYITLVEEEGQARLEWKSEPVSKEDLQSLLLAFKKRHKGQGSFYKVLANFSFPEMGYRLIGDTALEKIIHNAAKPAPHRPGKHTEEAMKLTVFTDVLKHFSAPLRHDQPLPDEVLAPLIAHYGRVERDGNRSQKAAEKLAEKNEFVLNDQGVSDALKRLFRRIKTDEQVESFEGEVKGVALKFQEKMRGDLEWIRDQHPPGLVAEKTRTSLDEHLKKAHMDYAKQTQGVNIYPSHLSATSVVAKQIDGQAQKNHNDVLKGVAASYEKEFVDSMGRGVSSFSASAYFQGKSRERAVDNVIKINASLSSLHQVAQMQHNTNMQILADNFGGSEVKDVLSETFKGQKQTLADAIKRKVAENYQEVLSLYDQDLSKLKSTNSGSFSEQLRNTTALAKISGELMADVKKLGSHRLPDFLEVERDFLNDKIKEATKPLLEKMRSYLPEAKSIGQTLTSAFARAFKPTPARILGGIPLLGGLVFSLAALPTAIAVPLGITAGIVLPVALLCWVGWNIYKRFDQRSEIQKLSAQMEKQWRDIDANKI
ncbi:hypothetical protein [Pseudomonas fluorescens]|uniref:hypothetical protein n=1 Tax=Pseudomonas fluorescens TaxID=294 RepID=UPI00123F353E|nr:hypothetical protein [Pseudomonas fluorescens]